MIQKNKEDKTMAINERIRFFRKLKGITQKKLGCYVGFSEKTADIRIAQYETEARIPKEDLIKKIATALDVSPNALNVPNIDTNIGVIHTLFALEDLYGFDIAIGKQAFNPLINSNATSILPLLKKWYEMAEKYRNGEITKEEYDNWRYNFTLSSKAV